MAEMDAFAEEVQRQIIEKAREMYSEIVVEHFFHPRSFGSMDTPDGYARIEGPCGDTMEIFVRVRQGRISKASYLTDGCITSIASASMAVELATDKEIQIAQDISKEDILASLGGLPEESQHCAQLASDTLRAAVRDYSVVQKEPRRTER